MQKEPTSSKIDKCSDTVVKQFHPLVSQFGFTTPEWDYDPESATVRVQFENSQRRDAIQIDCQVEQNSYRANYCQMEGDWSMCVQGKPNSLAGLRATLSRWIRHQCPDCGSKPEDREEYE
jgi:hypothetical protein